MSSLPSREKLPRMTAELLVPFFEEALGDNLDCPSQFGHKQNMDQGLAGICEADCSYNIKVLVTP